MRWCGAGRPPGERSRSSPSLPHPCPGAAGSARRTPGVELADVAGAALGVELHQADAGAVPEPFPRLGPIGVARRDHHAATLGEPVERRAWRIEPAVQSVEPVEQGVGEGVLHAAGGDLPESRPLAAMADVDVVGEGVVHVAGEDHVVARGAGVAEDVHHHARRAAVGHPVLGIHQQWPAGQGEEPLDGLDQLDAEHRRRRDDHHRRRPHHVLLELRERLPVHQAGRAGGASLAAPAPGAGVEDHELRVALDLDLPALEAQQPLEHRILLPGGQPARLVGGALEQRGGVVERRGQAFRVVAPALAEQVGEQGVADDPLREGVAVSGAFPVRGEVPVVGDVVVVEDHQRGQVGHHPGGGGQARGEALDHRPLGTKAFGVRLVQRRRLEVHQAPRGRRPGEQVQGDHLGEAHQVVVGVGRGEHRLARPAEEAFAHLLAALGLGQQRLAAIVARGVGVERLAVGHGGALQGLVEEPQATDQGMDGDQHRAGHVVGVDLVAGHQQPGRPGLGRITALGEPGVGAHQAVRALVMGAPAGAVHQPAVALGEHEAGVRGALVQQVGRPVRYAGRARLAGELQVVVDAHAPGQGRVEADVDQVQPGIAPQRQRRRRESLSVSRRGVCPTGCSIRLGARGREPTSQITRRSALRRRRMGPARTSGRGRCRRA